MFMKINAPVQRMLRIGFRKESVAPLAEAVFTYEINKVTVNVACRISPVRGNACAIYILNELGADYSPKSLKNNVTALPPPGWEPIGRSVPTPALCDERNGIQFSIADYTVKGDPSPRIFWGREKSASLCWAGFAFELDRHADETGDTALDYTVEFKVRENS